MTGNLNLPSSITTIGSDMFSFTTFNGDLTINANTSTLRSSDFSYMPNVNNIYVNYTGLTTILGFCFYQTVVSGDVFIYAPTAPSVGTNGVNFSNSPDLHVPVGATGYDVAPWTTEFSSVIYDL
jgi:hypothetical protein